jgi:hypothetical protein
MLGYRKRSFGSAHKLLSALRADHDDLGSLRRLQQLLMGEIFRTEAKTRALKAERKGVAANRGKSAAKRSSILAQRIERVRAAAYVWRCFGDAIAFEFLDKYALKQSFYDTGRPVAKQRAGFLSGKEGLGVEIAVLEDFLEKKVPAVLVDLTDSIRHGDICLLLGPDPQLIEVKAKAGLDTRGRRQRDGLAKLHEFFEHDEAEGLRGFAGVTRRTQFSSADRTYFAELNACIGQAMEKGHATVSPEPGLHYLAMTEKGPSLNEIVASLKLDKLWGFPLNEFKAERAWAPYYPFLLSIEGEAALWAFVRGDLYLVVIVETKALEAVVKEAGYVGDFDRAEEDYPLTIKHKDLKELTRVSSHYLRRMALEFVSPKWLVEAAIEIVVSRTPDKESVA